VELNFLLPNVPDQLHRTDGTTDASGAERNQHLACQRVGVSCIGPMGIFIFLECRELRAKLGQFQLAQSIDCTDK